MIRLLTIAVLGLLYAAPASALVTTCNGLKSLTAAEIEGGEASREAFLDCMRRGEDPPKSLRKNMGAAPVSTPVGNTTPTTPCRPGVKQQCPNNMREYTDGSHSPPGYHPENNPKLKIPEMPWGTLEDSQLPCGAIGTFAESALQSLLGKAQINVPISLSEATTMISNINGQFSTLQGLLSQIQAGTQIPQSQADSILSSISGQIDGLLSQIPMVGGTLSGQANNLMGQLGTQVSNLISAGTSAPTAQITSMIGTINGYIGTIQSLLGQAQNAVSSVQGQANSLINDVKGQINGALTGFFSNLFKYKDCQDGQFWGILNHIFTLVMGQGQYIYDVSNNTFISQSSMYATLPMGSTISIQPIVLGNSPSNFSLPAGGSFFDAQGNQVYLAPGMEVNFRSDGLVVASDGSQYKVNPRAKTELHPNEAIEIKAGTRVPVDPDGKIYPVSPITKVPDWLDADYAAAK